MASTNYAFNILDSVDSTNNYAMARVHAGLAKHGEAFVALRQTGGKGQRGKSWHTGNGENIALSIVMDPNPLLVAQQFELSASIALGCHDFLSQYAGVDTRIKWPNDLFWRDRKAGGVLIENVIGLSKQNPQAGTVWKYAVVGVGININQQQFDPGLQQAVSLRQITGKSYDLIELARQLHQCIMQRWQVCKSVPFSKTLLDYNQVLYKSGELVQLQQAEMLFETRIHSVKANGQLCTTDQEERHFNFGEVTWLLHQSNTRG